MPRVRAPPSQEYWAERRAHACRKGARYARARGRPKARAPFLSLVESSRTAPPVPRRTARGKPKAPNRERIRAPRRAQPKGQPEVLYKISAGVISVLPANPSLGVEVGAAATAAARRPGAVGLRSTSQTRTLVVQRLQMRFGGISKRLSSCSEILTRSRGSAPRVSTLREL